MTSENPLGFRGLGFSLMPSPVQVRWCLPVFRVQGPCKAVPEEFEKGIYGRCCPKGYGLGFRACLGFRLGFRLTQCLVGLGAGPSRETPPPKKNIMRTETMTDPA